MDITTCTGCLVLILLTCFDSMMPVLATGPGFLEVKTGFITSPNFPNSYADENFTQPKTITQNSNADYSAMWFEVIDLPDPDLQDNNRQPGNYTVRTEMNGCSDYVSVSEGLFLLNKVCGKDEDFSERDFSTIFGDDTFTVDFKTVIDGNSGAGFKMWYTGGVDEDTCLGLEFAADSGFIVSPGFPDPNSAFSANCGEDVKYLIKTPHEKRVRLTVLWFQALEGTCDTAFVDISGDVKICRENTSFVPVVYTSSQTTASTDFVYIRFIGKVVFMATYEMIDAFDKVSNVKGTIPKPDLEDSLEEKSCQWTLTGPINSSIILQSQQYPVYDRQIFTHDTCSQSFVISEGPNYDQVFKMCPRVNFFGDSPSNGNNITLSSRSNIIHIEWNGITDGSYYDDWAFKYSLGVTDSTNLTETSSIQVDHWCTHYTTTTTTTTTKPTTAKTDQAPKAPRINQVTPLEGLRAGGTRISVVGDYFGERLTVMLGPYETRFDSCSQKLCVVQTIPVNETAVGQSLDIRVQFEGYAATVLENYKFTYTANPKIDRIYPKETLISGGNTLTVKGSSFNGIGDPQLEITTVHTIFGESSPDVITNRTYGSDCSKEDASKMKCQYPALEIPEVFTETAGGGVKSSTNGRSHGVDFEFIVGNEELGVYVGFKLDGDESYKNLTESLPEQSVISVYALLPELYKLEEELEYTADLRVSVRGQRLRNALTLTDYKVLVGDVPGTLRSLTDTELVFSPPAEHVEGGQRHDVVVHPGTNKEQKAHVGFIRYAPALPVALIGGVVGGVALVIIIIVIPVVYCCCCRRGNPELKQMEAETRKKLEESRKHEAQAGGTANKGFSGDYLTPSGGPNGQFAKQEDYLKPSVDGSHHYERARAEPPQPPHVYARPDYNRMDSGYLKPNNQQHVHPGQGVYSTADSRRQANYNNNGPQDDYYHDAESRSQQENPYADIDDRHIPDQRVYYNGNKDYYNNP